MDNTKLQFLLLMLIVIGLVGCKSSGAGKTNESSSNRMVNFVSNSMFGDSEDLLGKGYGYQSDRSYAKIKSDLR